MAKITLEIPDGQYCTYCGRNCRFLSEDRNIGLTQAQCVIFRESLLSERLAMGTLWLKCWQCGERMHDERQP